MLDSPLWNLFYIASALTLFAFAYYSRHEVIQKLTLVWLVAFVATNLVIHTEHELIAYMWIDLVGMIYTANLFFVRAT